LAVAKVGHGDAVAVLAAPRLRFRPPLRGGSTGPPKAVRIAYANVVADAEAMFVGALRN
jgi:hypothetical protein